MKRIESILDIDRDYTIILKGVSADEVVGDIVAVEMATGKVFKVIEIDPEEELSDEEMEHLFNVLPRNSYKRWKEQVTSSYINAMYREVANGMVRVTMDIMRKERCNFDLRKHEKELENMGIQVTKNAYKRFLENLIDEHIERTFRDDVESGNVIAFEHGDDIHFVRFEDGVIILTPRAGLNWDEETGYELFEFLMELVAQNEGHVRFRRNGINFWVIADKEIYNQIDNLNGGVENLKEPVIIDVWGGWCQPCRMFERELIPKLRERRDLGVTVVRVSTDFNGWANEILKKWRSEGIPLIVLKDGSKVDVLKGYYEGIVDEKVIPFFEGGM